MKRRLVLLALFAAACVTSTPPPVITPPVPATYTLVVHVYEGDPAQDHKAVGAVVESGDQRVVADDAGNAILLGLPVGPREVCATAVRYTRTCASVLVGTVGELDLSLPATVVPTLPVRIDGRFFVTDAGTFRPLFQSGLSLLARGPPERDAFLDQTVALGFSGVRVFAGDLGWAGQTVASALSALPALLDAAQARGLYVYVCALTGGRDPVYDIEAHLRAVVEIVKGRPNVLLEVANEIGHATQSNIGQDPERLLALARSVIPPGVTWTLGAPDGPFKTDEPTPEGTYPTSGGQFNDAHLDRGRDLYNQGRRLREVENISSVLRTPAMSGEPIGIAEVPMPGKQRFWDKTGAQPQSGGFDDAATRFSFLTGVLCRGFELGCVFHSEQGLQGQLLGPNTQRAAQAFVAGWRSLPTTERLTFVNAGWQNSPVSGADFDNGIVRAYSFTTGSRGWTVLVGLKGDPQVRWGGGWRAVGVMADRPGLRLVEIAR